MTSLSRLLLGSFFCACLQDVKENDGAVWDFVLSSGERCGCLGLRAWLWFGVAVSTLLVLADSRRRLQAWEVKSVHFLLLFL